MATQSVTHTPAAVNVKWQHATRIGYQTIAVSERAVWISLLFIVKDIQLLIALLCIDSWVHDVHINELHSTNNSMMSFFRQMRLQKYFWLMCHCCVSSASISLTNRDTSVLSWQTILHAYLNTIYSLLSFETNKLCCLDVVMTTEILLCSSV